MSANHARPAQPYATRSLSATAADLQRACLVRDAEAVATFLAESVAALYPQPAPFIGREANRQVWLGVYAEPGVEHLVMVDEVVESEQGDMGYTYGRWRLVQPSAGPAQTGRWLAVWQPVDGAWQITHLSSNAFPETGNPAA